MKSLLSLFLLSLLTALEVSAQADFVENKGQWPSEVLFRADIPNGALWAEKSGFTYQFFDPSILQYIHPGANGIPGGEPVYREHSYRMHFENALEPCYSGDRIRSQYNNYYLGSDSSRWAAKVPIYGVCNYENIYAGVNLRLYSKSNSIKYDFIVKPSGDATTISMLFEGGIDLTLENGELHITTSVNTLGEHAPYAYQIIDGSIHEVSCTFNLVENRLSFAVGEYDHSFDLIIDPEIAFSTYIGSSASNFGFTACDDTQENLLSGAAVFAMNYPVTVGAFESNFNNTSGNFIDVAISKFSPDGSQLLYSTYLGGSKQETPHSIVADSQDNFILMGVTGSSNFPVTASAYQQVFAGGPILVMSNFFTSGHPNGCDFFISKFSSAGALTSSTYVGGDTNDGLNYANELFYNYGDAFRGEINVDANDDIFVASVVTGTFPTAGNGAIGTFGGGSDGILFKLNSSLSNLVFSTYIGGSGNDACYSIEFAPDGTMLVSGGTQSSNFPIGIGGFDTSFNGGTDGYILRIHPTSLSILSGSFVGTNEYDQAYFLQTDLGGNIYTLGQSSGNMSITPGHYGQPNSGQFIQKYSPTLSSLLWNTTIGTGSGAIDISPTAFLVSDCNQIYFSGWGGHTNSNTCQIAYDCYAVSSTTNGLPITSDAFQSNTDGSDFYLCVLSPDATALNYASFLGGSTSAEHVDGGTSRFDKNGSVYQAVCAGCQGNSDFPTTPNAWSDTNNSFGCNIAVFRFNLGQVNAELQIDGPSEICEGSPAQFVNLSVGATDYEWYFGDSFQSTEFEPAHSYQAPGTYTVQLIASDANGCLAPDTTSISITILPGVNPSITAAGPVCAGDPIQLNATGSTNLFWLDNSTLSAIDIPIPIANPQITTTYFAVDFNNCEADTVPITVAVFPVNTAISEDITICVGQSTVLTASGGQSYLWSPSTGLNSSTIATPTATPFISTTYSVAITTIDGCPSSLEVAITVLNNSPGGSVYPTLEMCLGNNVQLNAELANSYSWSPSESVSNPFISNPMAFPSDTTTYVVALINPCGSGTSEVTVNVIFPSMVAEGGGTICRGQSIPASAIGSTSYEWQPAVFANPYDEASTLLSPPESMYFFVYGVDDNGCGALDSVFVFVLPLPQVSAGPDQYFEYPGSVYLFGNAFGQEYNWFPTETLSCSDCPFPIASPDSVTWYYLSVMDHNGCVAIDSVMVKPYFPLWVPNTITPNNDGINDVFRAYGENIEGFHLMIFDRWGNKVFDSTNIEEVWTGGTNGYYVQNDSYVWTIEYDTIDRRDKLVGHVNVLR